MNSASAIALSGMAAASLRLQASASNVANQDDTAPLPASGVSGPKPYAPVRAALSSLADGGVQAQLMASQGPSAAAYDPANPWADKNGMVAAPDVDPVQETVERMSALQQYRSSAAVLETEGRMDKTILKWLA